MADALVHVIVDQLSSTVTREIERKVELVVGVEREVERLKSNLLAIKAALVDAEKRQFKEATVKQWLDKLKVVCYDIDDVLDEWNTAILKSQIEAGDKDRAASRPGRKVCSLTLSACPCFSWRKIAMRHDIACKIHEIDERLNDIAIEKNKYDFALVKDVEHIERPVTTSFVDITEVKGRDNDKNELKNMLLGESSKQYNPHVVSLVGMGGIGKTTLAKLVYNDNEVETEFERMIWVCVSDPFDEIRIAKAILESLSGETPNLVELQTLLQRVQQNLRGKKFLLVLDDVWEEDPRKWEQLKHCLMCGSPGSKIMMTTRKETVAMMMGSSDVYTLGMLSTEECWSIFCKVAFFGRTSGERGSLEGIGRKIVNKCKGLPLAAKTLGGLLRFKKTKEEWKNILDSELWDLEKTETDLFMAPLQLSYYDLPPALRRCFSFCAIFPKDHEIEKRYLIELWIAHGYLKETRGKSLDMVGEEYFHSLAIRSFFQDFIMDEVDDSIKSCKMHDMVHDFAKFLVKDECINIDINNHEEFGMDLDSFCKNVRHSMVEFPKPALLPNSFYHMKKLRSLLVESTGNARIEAALPNLVNQLTCLRSLNLRNCGVREIPSNINKLMHLRQLDLSYNRNLKELPETICELYNLQILDVSCCTYLVLPRGVGNLINLSHLHNSFCDSVLPKEIGKLSCLQMLDEFTVGRDNDSGSLRDLKDLNSLRGRLCVMDLKNVANTNELKRAQFEKKVQITSLDLYFGAGEAEWRRSHDEELLDALEPPPNLEALALIDCQAARMFPSWMISLRSLRWLLLYHGRNYEVLPPLGKLPSLEYLQIRGLNGVQRVGVEFLGIETGEDGVSSPPVAFPKLTSLWFDDMGNWEEWVDDFRRDGDYTKTSIIPCLRYLSFSRCPKLKAVPLYFLQKTTLKKLDISDCPILKQQYEMNIGDKSKILHNTTN